MTRRDWLVLGLILAVCLIGMPLLATIVGNDVPPPAAPGFRP